MYVYLIEKTSRFPMRFLIKFSIRKFQRDLHKNFGLKLNIDFRYNSYSPEVSLIDMNYNGDDWRPQFSFKVLKNQMGVYLHSLRLPKELRNKGIGKYCVTWLKYFCRKYGFTYIVLGSLEEAMGFWDKAGFVLVNEEDMKKYPYC